VKRLRKWLKEIRLNKDLTQFDVASMSGIDVTMYNKIELGNRVPSVETAKAIANVLGFPWTRFFEAEQNELVKIGTEGR